MTKYENDEKVIPSIAEWGKLYDTWAKKIAQSLWKWGSGEDALDAVQEAFLKIMRLQKDVAADWRSHGGDYSTFLEVA